MSESYKIGDIEFDDKESYEAAQSDLLRIRDLMSKYDTTNPEGAQALLDKLGKKPGFKSDYGTKFLEKLTVTAAESKKAKAAAAKEAKQEKKAKSEKSNKTKAKADKPRHSIHIITKRNIIILGCLLIAALGIRFGLFNPYGFDIRNYIGVNQAEIEGQRNMVTYYASTQSELVEGLTSFYINNMNLDENDARAKAQNDITSNYAVNLAGQDISKISNHKLKKIYNQLVEEGDIIDGCFIEPESITILKESLNEADYTKDDSNTLTGDMGNTSEEDATNETDKNQVINSMMDAQAKLSAELYYDYSHFGFDDGTNLNYVDEDLTKIYTHKIYDRIMSAEEKEMYYDAFVNLGLITGSELADFSTDPLKYGLPVLNPDISLDFKNGFSAKAVCAQQTLSPVTEVTYALYGKSVTGYIMFRNNGEGTDYVQIEEDDSELIMGDFYMLIDNQITIGSWFNNHGKIGIVVNGAHYGDITSIYSLIYE